MKTIDYVKANRRGSREADLDNGFKSTQKVHKSKKAYSRKLKYKSFETA
jgi:hypothetical protein